MPRNTTKLRDFRYQILRPLAFLSIGGPTLNIYRWWLPALSAIVLSLAGWLLPAGFDVVGDKSLSDYMATFFAALPGFFIAALAAVVAFSGGDLDTEMPDVSVKIAAHGDVVRQPITLRVFLSYLFAYLTILSFVGFFVCLGAVLIAPSIVKLLPPMSAGSATGIQLCKVAFTAVVSFLSASIVFCTAQGLYFLAERVHQTLLPREGEGE